MDRTNFSTLNSVEHAWAELGLPLEALHSLRLAGKGLGVPSSFKVGHIAQASIALSALTAALIYSHRNQVAVPQTTVALRDAVIEFKSERLITLNNNPIPSLPPLGGLVKAADGYIRVHDAFPNHREGAKKMLDCAGPDDRTLLIKKVSEWSALELENKAVEAGLPMTALRSYKEWDALLQSSAISDFPITIKKIADGPPRLLSHMKARADKCLRGLRVVEMTRVIAGPVAGKTLAAHGADVVWITSPNLSDIPAVDRDVARGKRSVSLDIDQTDDRQVLDTLLENGDVFIQSYRPKSLANKDLSPEHLALKSDKGIICANLSAYGPDGPWSDRRGFDSLVQTCSGLNVSEAEHFGAGEPSRVLPCQVLDHASGYFLATGINAALYRQATEGGSYEVNVSLAGTMKYLRSLGQYDGNIGFDCPDFNSPEEVFDKHFEERDCGFGILRAIKHSAKIEGLEVGWDVMPKPLGSDEAAWL